MGYTHGIQWTEQMIIDEIKKVMKALDISRMPSRTEIAKVTGNQALGNKISRNGGYRHWAKRLGLELKASETKTGNDYEFKMLDLLKNKGYKTEKMTTKHPYDLLINDNVKVDVKVSHYYCQDNFKYHTFNLDKPYHNCDIFILVGLDDADNIEKLLIVPSKFVMGLKQISIGVNSKYDKFANKFDYIDKYINFYEEL